jgi:hypothetical protein
MPILGSCEEAVTRLVRLGRTIEPVAAWTERYDESFRAFVEALAAQGVRPES